MAPSQAKSLTSFNILLVIIATGVISLIFVRHALRCRSVSKVIPKQSKSILELSTELSTKFPSILRDYTSYISHLIYTPLVTPQNAPNEPENTIPTTTPITTANTEFEEHNERIEMIKTNVICPALLSQIILYNEMNEINELDECENIFESQYLYNHPGTVCETAIIKKTFTVNYYSYIMNDISQTQHTNLLSGIIMKNAMNFVENDILFIILPSEYNTDIRNINMNIISNSLIYYNIIIYYIILTVKINTRIESSLEIPRIFEPYKIVPNDKYSEEMPCTFWVLISYTYPSTICVIANLNSGIIHRVIHSIYPDIHNVLSSKDGDVIGDISSQPHHKLANKCKDINHDENIVLSQQHMIESNHSNVISPKNSQKLTMKKFDTNSLEMPQKILFIITNYGKV